MKRFLFVLAMMACPAADYVDGRACAACHREIAADYAKTGMGRSFFRPAAANTIEAYAGSYYHAPSDTHFSMTARDGSYYQRRWQIGFGGKETNVEEMRVDYVMGSGNHARSYLHRTARGTLIELPLGWYAENGGQWAMAPGSDSEHPRTRRFISYRCMGCHNGIPKIPASYEAPGSDPVYVGELPQGIDCQRCHGPGAEHVRLAGKGKIVNPAKLDAARRQEVCLQCHLETTSGRIPSAIIRFNRGPFSFVPGERLQDFLLTFDHAKGTGHDGKFEAVGSVYRMRQSRCFQESEGRLSCESCHNPHRAPRGAEAVAHYAAACRQCHAQVAGAQHGPAADCVGCHMPKRRAEDTPGMVMTDHLIQRGPIPEGLTTPFRERPPREYLGEVIPYYPAPLARNDLYYAVAQVGLKNNVAEGLPLLAEGLARIKPAEAEFYSVLGDGWMSTGKTREAITAFERAVALSRRPAAALRSLGGAWQAGGDLARATEVLGRALRAAPEDATTWFKAGLLDSAAGRLPEAVAKIRRAVALDASLPEQSRSLGEVLLRLGHGEDARAALREALRTDPYDDAAWDLQARALAESGEVAEAVYCFERAVRLNRNEASYLFNYALLLARMNRLSDAFPRTQAALRLNPKYAEAHELMGGLLERRGELREAADSYRRVLELRPGAARPLLRLGSVLAALGDGAGAAEYLRQATRAGDAAIAAQATELLRKLGR